MASRSLVGLATLLVAVLSPSFVIDADDVGVVLTPAVGVGRVVGEGCADVLLLAAPGDGEVPVAGSPQSAGATLDHFARAYTTAAAEARRTVVTKVVAPATAPAERLRAQSGPDGPSVDQVTRASLKSWRGDLGTTVGSLVREVDAAAAACPDQQLVLAGYSQGATAMHRVLLRLEQLPSVSERITAAVLISDGFRQPGLPRRSLLGEPRASRAGQGVVTLFRAPPAAVPSGTAPLRVWQVCARGDLVCDIGRTPYQAAVTAHRSYRTDSADMVAELGRRVFARTSRWALPDPVQETLEVQAGTPVEVQLGVRVHAPHLASVRWSDVLDLPPGLTLDQNGMLTGSPSKAGAYEVTYSVVNTASPVFDRPAVGRLTVNVEPEAVESQQIAAGGDQSCSVRPDGTAWCWGDNGYGQLGNGTSTSARRPVQVGDRAGWVTLSTGGASTCGIRTDGRAYCWGLNRWGQLGDGTRTNRERPVAVADPGPWKSVVAGWSHTCGVKVDGTAWCWGRNEVGQLGDGTLAVRLTPVPVAGAGTWSTVALGGWHTCGVRTDGTAWCWGRNHFGELAESNQVIRTTPRRIGTATDWVQLDLSWSSSCGVRAGGTVWCWGKNDKGQLGDGSVQPRVAPVQALGDRTYAEVSVGDAHTCARTDAGRVWCWGYGSYGQLGNGTQVDSSRTPVAVPGTWQSFDAGWYHGCGVTRAGDEQCWGANVGGQLGDGTSRDRSTPTSNGAVQ